MEILNFKQKAGSDFELSAINNIPAEREGERNYKSRLWDEIAQDVGN